MQEFAKMSRKRSREEEEELGAEAAAEAEARAIADAETEDEVGDDDAEYQHGGNTRADDLHESLAPFAMLGMMHLMHQLSQSLCEHCLKEDGEGDHGITVVRMRHRLEPRRKQRRPSGYDAGPIRGARSKGRADRRTR
jgi:hypothetical protein